MNMDPSTIDIKYNETLSSRLELLVGKKFGSDLTFIIEDTVEEIPAHKLIVALSSPVLQRIVYGNETFPPSDVIKVDRINKENFMQILLYIYTDRINLNEDNVFEILQKSNYFGLTGIESKCLEYLEHNLNTSTVPWIYHQLYFSDLTKLLNKCLLYIRIQPLEFFASEYFEKICIDELKSIFALDAINCTEIDLFDAMIRLSKAHCAAGDLQITAANQRKILGGTEQLLRLESLTESEFDECLAIQTDFYSTTEVEKIRNDIRNGVGTVRRKWYTYPDAVWIEVNGPDIPASSFYADSYKAFIYRYYRQGAQPLFADYILDPFHEYSNSTIEVLCGSGYEWRKCVNGEIPIGSVPISSISSKHLEPVFIARGAYRHSSYTGIAKMNGTMRMTMPDQDGDTEDEARCETLTEFEVLVAKNVKHPYNGIGVPTDAIFIGYNENNYKTYLGRVWFQGDLLPAKVIFQTQSQAFVPYGGEETQINEFEFVRMDPGTYEWEPAMNGEVPDNAVIAGCTSMEERLYFGRILHHGIYIPGKVHPSHGVLYVPFRGEEINFRTYEVLVHSSDM